MEHVVTEVPRLTESASAVFAVLAQAGSATRPQLASLAGLSKPTVSAAVAELESTAPTTAPASTEPTCRSELLTPDAAPESFAG
ncbi:helix-turn-helix domain-containing protein, partial [Streptomyces sp. NPDC005388]|uniref:MarR family transcriptional regulator n=1 Tax=Streptomyces sp. NPDC005388 TaxID=3156717 RepID=UPI0033BB8ECE